MNLKYITLIFGILLLVGIVGAVGGPTIEGYTYFQKIEYSGCDQGVYQQDIVIHRSTGTAYNETSGGMETWHIYVGEHCREDYGDVRFVNSTGELAYYLWPDYNSTYARFTVRLEGATTAGTLTVWYGNPAASTTSDGDAVYEFYDGFSAGTIDTIKWYQSKAASINDGICTVPSGGYLAGKVNYPVGYTTQIVVRYTSGANSWAGIESTFGTTQSKDLDMVNQITANAGSGSSYGGSSHGVNMASEYREVTITRTGGATNRTIILIDGAEKYNTSAYASTANRHPVFNAYSGAIYVKSAIVRAYSAAPPAALTFSGEQVSGAAPPRATFTATPTTGPAPLTVQFTDTSIRSPTSWAWAFGDGGTSSQQSPSHTYAAPGTYTVTLTVSNAYGSNVMTKTNYITVSSFPPIIASPTYNTTIHYDMANGTYLQYWLFNVTTFGDIPIYGFAYGIMAPLMNVWGYWVFIMFWLAYLFIVWIRTSDIGLPIIIGLLTAGVWGLFFPPEAMQFAYLMFGISIAALLTKLAIEYL